MSGHIPHPRGQARQLAPGELVATVARITWEGEEGEASIIETRDGQKAVVEGAAQQLEEGETYRFLGSYVEDAKWGRQFKASAWLTHAGHDKRGVVKYLATNCTGIGQVLATRLWDLLGADAVKVFREDYERVAGLLLLDHLTVQRASEELQKAAKFEATTIDLFSLFAGKGFSAKTIKRCIDKWGVKAAEVCTRNPFGMLLASIPGAGFKRCDRLYLEAGGDPAALKRQALAGWQALRDASTGNTWHPLSLFAKGVAEQVGAAGSKVDAAKKLASRARLIVERANGTIHGYLADPRQAANEKNLAADVKRLFDSDVASWADVSEPDVSAHQAEQLAGVLESPLFLLTGIPGTGKTYAAAAVLRAAATKYGQNHIAVCAPTGKAAVRITEGMRKAGLNIEATTIHRRLGVTRGGYDGQGWGFEFTRENPLPHRFLAVDEWSMCDTDLAAALFSAIATGTNVMLIGDPYQLPPVGHGAPLRDMIAAGLPRAHLTEIKRNSGLITSACQLVKDGKSFATAEKLNIEGGQNLRLIECEDEISQLEALRAVIDAVRGKPGSNIKEDLQVLTPCNDKGRVSRKPLNAYLQLLINPEQSNDVKGKAEGFRLRDKVICLSNTVTEMLEIPRGRAVQDAASWHPKPQNLMTENRCFVANGDMGYVVGVSLKKAEVVVKFSQPDRFVRWRLGGKSKDENGKIGGGKEDLALAYAITGHKSQGSEWPYVVVMIDPAGDRVASREWWYTAISRASRAGILIGRRATIDRQCRRAELPLRKTFLREMLQEIEEVTYPTGPEVAGFVTHVRPEREVAHGE